MPPDAVGRTQAERIVALETQMVESQHDRGDLWKSLSDHKSLDDHRFEEIRQVLLGRPSWTVTIVISLLLALLTATASGLIVSITQSR